MIHSPSDFLIIRCMTIVALSGAHSSIGLDLQSNHDSYIIQTTLLNLMLLVEQKNPGAFNMLQQFPANILIVMIFFALVVLIILMATSIRSSCKCT